MKSKSKRTKMVCKFSAWMFGVRVKKTFTLTATDQYDAMEQIRKHYGADYERMMLTVFEFGKSIKGPKVSALAFRAARNAGPEEE